MTITTDSETLCQQLVALTDRAQAMSDRIRREDRAPTSSEKYELDRLLDVTIPAAQAAIKRAEREERDVAASIGATIADSDDDVFLQRVTTLGGGAEQSDRYSAPAEKWLDAKTGEKIYCLSNKQRLADIDRDGRTENLSVGRYIQSRLTGNWKNSQAELRCAQGENSNQTGGYLVPDELARQVIDLARSKSVLMQAGMQTIPMASDRLTIARVSADPSFEVKAENAAFSESDITFDNIGFTAYTVGQVVRASKELAMDAPNFPQLIEQVLADSLAAEIDRLALRGSGSAEPTGILNSIGIGSTASVAAISWEEMNTGVVDILGNNFQPNAYIAHPTIHSDLTMLTTGDGTNSAKGWLPAPPLVAPLTPLVTTNITTADVLIGDFTQALFAVRTGVDIVMSDQAEDFFTRHQVGFKITIRFDINLARAGAFHALNGVTT